MKHTPTPWYCYNAYKKHILKDYHIASLDGYEVATVNSMKSANDAHFIVTACNHHNDLIMALESAQGAIANAAIKLEQHEVGELRTTLKSVNAALAKIESDTIR